MSIVSLYARLKIVKKSRQDFSPYSFLIFYFYVPLFFKSLFFLFRSFPGREIHSETQEINHDRGRDLSEFIYGLHTVKLEFLIIIKSVNVDFIILH